MAKTITMISEVATVEAASEAIAAFMTDDPGSDEFTVTLSPTGSGEPTHKALSIPMTEDLAQRLLQMCSGSLPSLNYYGNAFSLAGYNVTEANALAAMAALVAVAAVDEEEGVTPTDHLNAQCELLQIQRINPVAI